LGLRINLMPRGKINKIDEFITSKEIINKR
jgi:hypothetical protein